MLDYEDGFCKINWENAEKRDYDDSVSKNACMAECLAVSPVKPEDFFTIYIADNNTKDYVEFLATNMIILLLLTATIKDEKNIEQKF